MEMVRRYISLLLAILALYAGFYLGLVLYSVYAPEAPDILKNALTVTSYLYLGFSLATVVAVFIHFRKR